MCSGIEKKLLQSYLSKEILYSNISVTKIDFIGENLIKQKADHNIMEKKGAFTRNT